MRRRRLEEGFPSILPSRTWAQQARAEIEGGSPEGKEREVKGVTVGAERVVAASGPSVRGSCRSVRRCPQCQDGESSSVQRGDIRGDRVGKFSFAKFRDHSGVVGAARNALPS